MRTTLLLLTLLLLPLAAEAQMKDSLIINLKDGRQMKIDIDQIKMITFDKPLTVESEKGLKAKASYPNPSTGAVNLSIDLAGSGPVSIEISNSRGDIVRKLTTQLGEAIVWDGKTDNGLRVASGTYFFSAMANGKIQNGKLIIQ